jgi:glycosyltransferase involved in cell wall biosynthesis
MSEKKEKPNVGIFTMPVGVGGAIIPLSNLIDVVLPNASDLYLITGESGYPHFKDDKRVRIRNLPASKTNSSKFVIRALGFVYMQLKAPYEVARVGKRVDSWIFCFGADCLPLAVLAAKISGRQVRIFLIGNVLEAVARVGGSTRTLALLFKASRWLADGIILYSDLTAEWGLEPYRRKIIIAHEHFLDFNEFTLKINPEHRANVIGYVGRLSAEKGILNFVEAIPKTLEKRGDLTFLIVGAGKQQDKVRTLLDEYSLESKVKLTGWVPHTTLPDCLNSMKLLIVPSYTEGLPNSVLEAMACGTPVLATSVGAIPGVIKDRVTGFLLRDNSPACIAAQIVETLSDPNLQQVVTNARTLVEGEFRYETTVHSWANVLSTSKER